MQAWEVIWGSHRGPPGSQSQGLYQRTETRYVHALRECVCYVYYCVCTCVDAYMLSCVPVLCVCV